jgi:hypothetical protein
VYQSAIYSDHYSHDAVLLLERAVRQLVQRVQRDVAAVSGLVPLAAAAAALAWPCSNVIQVSPCIIGKISANADPDMLAAPFQSVLQY